MRIQDRILEYLQKGKTITALQCQQMFGALRLRSLYM